MSHKAIELSVSWRGDPSAGELVDEAIARLIAGDDRIGDYLGGLREGERAELHGEATERVNMFLECFPRLEPRWRPVAESRLRADLNDDRIVLSGQGRPHRRAGRGPACRQGARRPEDRRLLARATARTCASTRWSRRCGSACRPACSATYYLDGGRLQQEPVSEPLLRGALERVVDGVEAAVALLHEGREPVLKAGPPCRWCPRRHTCEVGRRYLEHEDDLDQDPDGDW